jgi:hypothetical protein
MNWRLALGLAMFLVGMATMPFGWWLSRIYYYAGLLLSTVGAALCFSAYRNRKIEDAGWAPPNDPVVPVVGEARGFKGRDVFDGPHGGNESNDATD